MSKYSCIKYSFAAFSLCLILGNIFCAPAKALTVVDRSEFNIAPSGVKQVDNLNLPNSIIVAPVFMPGDLMIQDSEWYEGLYYYMADRLGQGDFMAHYIMTNDGQILEGNSKGVEQRFTVADDTYTKPIVILYLANADQTDFTLGAKASLSDLIIDLANNNAIKLSNVVLRSIDYTYATGQPITLTPEILGGMWEVSLKQVTGSLAAQYKPVIKTYNISLVSVDLPAAAVNYGDTVRISVAIKNNSDFVLYQGTDYEPILELDSGESSKFYLNGTWLSRTQAEIMSEGSFIKPGETKAFEVSLFVPLYFGTQTEKFHIEDMLGKKYTTSPIAVTLNITHPNSTVVEITQTETGQLNVREGPWASSNISSRVTPGQRFIVLEKTDSGYTKLDLGNGKSGWVVSKYTKSV